MHGLDRRHLVVLSVLVLVGVYVRLRALGAPPLWIDEAHTSWAARNFLNGQGFSDAVGPSSPYRRAWLTTSLPIAGSFAVFGISEFAARLPVVAYGVLAIPIAYLLGARFDRILGYLLAAFVALDPFIVVWTRTARMYGPLLFVYLASVYVILRWYDADFRFRSPYPFVLAVLVAAGMNTQQSYLALGAATGVFLVVVLLSQMWASEELTWDSFDGTTKRMLVLVVAGGLAAAGFLVVRGFPSIVTAPAPEAWPERGLTYYWSLFGREYLFLRVLALGGAVYAWARYEAARLVVLAFVVPFVVASITPRKAPRYVVHLVPLLGFLGLLPIADGFRLAWDQVTEDVESVGIGSLAVASLGPLFVILLVASPLAGFAVADSPYNPPYQPERSDWGAASEWLEGQAEADDVIVSTRPELSMWYFGRTEYFFRQRGLEAVVERDGEFVHSRTGTVFLNETANVERLVDGDRDVWIFAGKKFEERFTDPAARAIIEDHFERRGDPTWKNVMLHYIAAGKS